LITPVKSDDENKFNFLNYTQENYDSIVKWKTAFYSFVLPIQNALYLANINDLEVHSKCKEILNKMVCVNHEYLAEF
jgi:farnesyl diphosphate synthase